MKNEFELTIKYFDKRAIATRRELWNKIADLQSQLQQANEIINNPDTLIFQQQQLIGNLQSQLAEKEEKIKDMKFMMRNTEQALNNVPNAMAGQRKRIDELTKELKQSEHNKISFTIEHLEKVKETAECVLDNALKNSSLNQSYYDRLLDEIDNQIKQLKEGK